MKYAGPQGNHGPTGKHGPPLKIRKFPQLHLVPTGTRVFTRNTYPQKSRSPGTPHREVTQFPTTQSHSKYVESRTLPNTRGLAAAPRCLTRSHCKIWSHGNTALPPQFTEITRENPNTAPREITAPTSNINQKHAISPKRVSHCGPTGNHASQSHYRGRNPTGNHASHGEKYMGFLPEIRLAPTPSCAPPGNT